MVADHKGGQHQGGIGCLKRAHYQEGLVSNSKHRKNKAETPPILSKSRRTQRRLVEANLGCIVIHSGSKQ
jgi:hypothetical protein